MPTFLGGDILSFPFRGGAALLSANLATLSLAREKKKNVLSHTVQSQMFTNIIMQNENAENPPQEEFACA